MDYNFLFCFFYLLYLGVFLLVEWGGMTSVEQPVLVGVGCGEHLLPQPLYRRNKCEWNFWNLFCYFVLVL